MNTQPSFSDYFFSFDGRIGRFEFWFFLLILNLIGGALFAITWGANLLTGRNGIIIGIIGYVIDLLIIAWPAMALSVKRCHDRNRSGLFVFIALIPLVNLWYIIEMLFLKGTEGRNKYGYPTLESSLKVFQSTCPVCGSTYGFVDKISQPLMCRVCWKTRKTEWLNKE